MPKKRILIASNFDDEMFKESFLNVPPVDADSGQCICNDLNNIEPDGTNYYKLVDVDYIPYEFTP